MNRLIAILIISFAVGPLAEAALPEPAGAPQSPKRLQKAKGESEKIKRTVRLLKLDLNRKLQAAQAKDDELRARINEINANVGILAARFDARSDVADSDTPRETISSDRGLSGSVATIVVGMFTLAVLFGLTYLLLRQRILNANTRLMVKLKETREKLDEQIVEVDSKLIEALSSKVRSIEEIGAPDSTSTERDHSLALRVADEIVRIEKNLSIMDPELRGRKQLAAAVRRIRDTFSANGYEIVEMLGRQYKDGMKVTAIFRPDDTLAPDERLITGVLKPQVNFEGKLIQAAHLEVSQG